MEKIKKLWKEKQEYIIHLMTYGIFGVLTTIVSWGSFWLFTTYLPMIDVNISNIISIFLSIVFAYFTNRKYVFHSKEKNRFKEFLSFLSSRGVTFIFEVVCVFIFVSLLKFPKMIVKVAVSIVVVILNYILSKIFVFKNGGQANG